MTANHPITNDPPSILIVGSSNTDMVIKTSHLPEAGETIIGGNFFMGAGGKGANQAVAASRLGAKVGLVCKTGNDIFGRNAEAQFRQEGINTEFVFQDAETPSGIAVIIVDDKGENSIVVAPGANVTLKPADVDRALHLLEGAVIVLAQLEIPLDVVEYLAAVTYERNKLFILNPAPASKLPDDLFGKISVITPNRKEAEMISGIKVQNLDTAKQAAVVINNKGVETVVITLGDQGALLFHENVFTHISAVPVDVLDTTSAGDVFNAALAVALSENRSMSEAVSFACKAAAISVTRLGAQASAPFRREITSD